MSEFDDLLDDVLQQDGNPQSPAGLNGRLLASLTSGVGRSRGQSALWAGAAAVVAIGVFGLAAWTLAGAHGVRQVATDSTPRVLERPITRAAEDTGGPHLPAAGQERGQSYSHHRVTRGSLPSRQRSIRIAPVVIEPLVIDSINIAAISREDSAMKGSTK